MDSQTINTQARKQTRARYDHFSRLSNNTKQSPQQAIGRTRLRCLAISDVLPLKPRLRFTFKTEAGAAFHAR